MSKRHLCHQNPALPRLWLMTDERMGEALWPALMALPKGAGVIFRHYSLARAERLDLFRKIRVIARARRLTLLAGGPGGAHGRHFGAVTAPVHSLRERIAAERNGAKLIFVSPVFPTASHPGARALGRNRFGLLIRGSRVPVIALGGMTRKRARSLSDFRIHGWAAISSLTHQKRNAVPT
ncbi:MAG: thiamine phosphate synthase [Sphingomonadaceae bacterium]|mgnify:FL=1